VGIRALIEAILLEPDGEQLQDHAEGRFGGNAERGQRKQEVARYRRLMIQIKLVRGRERSTVDPDADENGYLSSGIAITPAFPFI
jgi:hypothetical protein